MSQVILVETNLVLTDLYTINLRNYVGADVILRDSSQGVIDLLHSHTSIDLIITRSHAEKEKTALEIYKYLQATGRSIPIIVLGEEPLIEKFSIQMARTAEVKILIKSAAQLLGITPRDMAKKSVDDYIMIPIYYLLILENLTCDVYAKARSSTNGYIYQKKFSINDKVNVQILKDTIKKGVKYLYVSREDRLKFTNQISAALVEKMKSEGTPPKDKMGMTSNAMEIVRDEFLRDGSPSQEIIELTELSIQSVQSLVALTPSLKLLLDNLISDKLTWAYRHCQLVTFIASRTLERLKWGGPEQYRLIAFVAFFHDISLLRDDLIQIDSEDKLKLANLKDKEKEMVIKHAITSARLIEKFPRSPMGSETIIKQHHGSIVGLGFPKHYSNNLSPMAILFLVAEELTSFFLEHANKTLTRADFFILMRKKYPRSMYQKVIEAMAEIL